MDLLIVMVIVIGVWSIVWLICSMIHDSPSFNCSHEWEYMQHTKTDYYDTYMYSCKSCGKITKKRI